MAHRTMTLKQVLLTMLAGWCLGNAVLITVASFYIIATGGF